MVAVKRLLLPKKKMFGKSSGTLNRVLRQFKVNKNKDVWRQMCELRILHASGMCEIYLYMICVPVP